MSCLPWAYKTQLKQNAYNINGNLMLLTHSGFTYDYLKNLSLMIKATKLTQKCQVFFKINLLDNHLEMPINNINLSHQSLRV